MSAGLLMSHLLPFPISFAQSPMFNFAALLPNQVLIGFLDPGRLACLGFRGFHHVVSAGSMCQYSYTTIGAYWYHRVLT